MTIVFGTRHLSLGLLLCSGLGCIGLAACGGSDVKPEQEPNNHSESPSDVDAGAEPAGESSETAPVESSADTDVDDPSDESTALPSATDAESTPESTDGAEPTDVESSDATEPAEATELAEAGTDVDPAEGEDTADTDETGSTLDGGAPSDTSAPNPGTNEDAGPVAPNIPPSTDDDPSEFTIADGIACTMASSGFEEATPTTKFATLYWNGSIASSECALEAGLGESGVANEHGLVLLRFAEESGDYGPFSIWEGENGPYGYGIGFTAEDSNHIPADVDLSVIVSVTEPPIVLEVFFRFAANEVTVQKVEQRL